MAADYIKFDRNTEVGRKVARGLQMIREGRDVLRDAREEMIRQKDGDGSQASQFDLLAAQGGYEAGDYADANAAAKASFDEIDSLYAKLTTPAGQTAADVGPAITQACAKHGV